MSLVSNKTVPLPHSLSRFLKDPCRLSPLVSILPSRSFALFSTLAEISPVFANSYENYPRVRAPRHQIGTLVPTVRTHRFPYARLSIAIFHCLCGIPLRGLLSGNIQLAIPGLLRRFPDQIC